MPRSASTLALALLLGGGVLLPAAPPLRAAAGPGAPAVVPLAVPVRAGVHPGMGRVVFDWPEAPGYSLVQEGEMVDLRFGTVVRLGLGGVVAKPPPNVLRVEPVPGGLRLHLRPGARLRHYLLGPRLVLDVLDPPGASPTLPPRRVAEPAPSQPAVSQPAASQPAASQPAVSQAAPSAGPARAEPGAGAPPALARREEAALAAIAALARQADAPAAPAPAPVPHPAMAAGDAASLPAEAPGPSVPGPSAMPSPSPPPAAAAATGAAPAISLAAPQPAPQAEPPRPQPVPPRPLAPASLGGSPTADALARAAAPLPRAAAPRPAPLALPFPAGTAAAALLRGDSLLLAFDSPQPPDAATLRRLAAALGPVEVMEVPGSTVLRQRKVRHPAQLRATPEGGWALWPEDAGAPAAPAVQARHEAGPAEGQPRLLLRAEGAGRVIAVPDPAGDGLLLLGLVAPPGAALHGAQQHAPFDLLPTQAGVALAVRSDLVTLRSVPEGFAVPLARGGALALQPAPAGETLLALPDEPVSALLARRHAAFNAVAAAPSLARGPLRLALAESLLALGLGVEAQALTTLAVTEDPRLASEPRAILLSGAGALLAGRAEEAAAALEDARLPAAQQDVRLWRALAGLRDDELAPESEAALRELEATAPLLRAWPEALRRRLLPLAARSLAGQGRADTAAALLRDLPDGEAATPGIAYARARIAEAQGDHPAALAAYGPLAEGRDRDLRARAIGRMAELRLAAGETDPAGAAAALAAGIAAWRGDERELSRRLRAAALYREAGQAEAALELLEETLALFPDAAPQIAVLRDAAAMQRLVQPGLPALEAAQRLEAEMQTLPAGPALDAAALRVANGLAGLDLHAQGAALLRQAALRSAQPAPLRLREAELLVSAGEGAGALAALRAAPGEEEEEADVRREMTEARALALSGDAAGAEAALRGLGAAGAARLATLLAERKDWTGAAAALARHAAASLPAAPAPLDEAQRRLLLRLAAYQALAGDEAGLAALRASYGPRLAGGPLAEAFSALAAEAPRPGLPDLDRLRREVAMGQALSEQLRSLR